MASGAEYFCDSCFAPWASGSEKCRRCGAIRDPYWEYLQPLRGPTKKLFKADSHHQKLSVLAHLEPGRDPSVVGRELFESGFDAGRELVREGHPHYRAELQPFWYAVQTAGETFEAKVMEREIKFREWGPRTVASVNATLKRLLEERYGALVPVEFTKAKFGRWFLANTVVLVLLVVAFGSSSESFDSLLSSALVVLSLGGFVVLDLVRGRVRKKEKELRKTRKSQEQELALREVASKIFLEGVLLAFAIEQGHRDAILEDARRGKWTEFRSRPEQVEKEAERKRERLERSLVAVQKFRRERESSRQGAQVAPRSPVQKRPRFRSQSPSAQAENYKHAEQLCARWLESKGEPMVRLTTAGADGGVDIESARVVAQVKNLAGAVGAKPVREIFGVAAARGKTALFFSSGGYTTAAKDFARRAGMALFTFDGRTGVVRGANPYGRDFIDGPNDGD